MVCLFSGCKRCSGSSKDAAEPVTFRRKAKDSLERVVGSGGMLSTFSLVCCWLASLPQPLVQELTRFCICIFQLRLQSLRRCICREEGDPRLPPLHYLEALPLSAPTPHPGPLGETWDLEEDTLPRELALSFSLTSPIGLVWQLQRTTMRE